LQLVALCFIGLGFNLVTLAQPQVFLPVFFRWFVYPSGMEKKNTPPVPEEPQGKFAEVIRKSKERRIQLMDQAARKEREVQASLTIPDDIDDD
jgi:hypothetical protein